ncbi:hypothetical protein C8D77_13115 [Mesorhizobium loti]|uniref:Uncharacterized protein n=1 Tax=Rhizobium loti TaxID=381 RepID=A0A8E2W875_RHILI|nr:hypothetical protein C8D77_13115 [Mesorhizobium loti]
MARARVAVARKLACRVGGVNRAQSKETYHEQSFYPKGDA